MACRRVLDVAAYRPGSTIVVMTESASRMGTRHIRKTRATGFPVNAMFATNHLLKDQISASQTSAPGC